MGQEVYKNNDGAVLFGNSGNVFRRPYAFENALLGTSPYYAFISLPNLDYGNVSVCYSSMRKLASINAYLIELFLNGVTSHSIKTQNTAHYYVASSAVNVNTPTIASFSTGAIGNELFDLFSFVNRSDGVIKLSSGNGIHTVIYEVGGTYDTYIAGNTLTGLKFGTFGLYTHANVASNRCLVFNRALSNEELKYIYNNGLGSEPLTTNGIVVDVKFNRAEILDFSVLQDGSDLRVACRDYSGNHYHAQLFNLPAGTLEEQRDFANANLFVPFID